jgi:glycosyltransferase involved in cell wall biosynthesis
VLRIGLRRLGVEVGVCGADRRQSVARRYVELGWNLRRAGPATALLVPEFRHKDVPLARLAASIRGADLIVDPLVSRHDTKIGDWAAADDGSFQSDHNRRIDRAAVRFADLLLCDTPQHAAYFASTYRVPASRCAVVPVGFDDARWTSRPEPPEQPFRVAFFGSYLPLHGIETIVEAAARVPEVRWTLIGGGMTFPIVRDAMARGVRLDLVPWQEPAVLVERLAEAHVLLGVFGTGAKTARVVPNKLYQGMALGRASITGDSPAIRSFFTPGEHLLTVPCGDAAALAAAVRRLRDEPALRARLALAGAARVHTHFNPQAVAARLLSAGRDLLGWSTPS